MISDVLSDAVFEIKRYRRDFAAYEGLEKEIDYIVATMEALQRHLDNPHSPEPSRIPWPTFGQVQ